MLSNNTQCTYVSDIFFLFSITDFDFEYVFFPFSGTPINRLPIMAKQVLDLYELYNLVTARGGLVEVINKKQWQEIIKGLNLPSSITSAAFTLRTQWVPQKFITSLKRTGFLVFLFECEYQLILTKNRSLSKAIKIFRAGYLHTHAIQSPRQHAYRSYQ